MKVTFILKVTLLVISILLVIISLFCFSWLSYIAAIISIIISIIELYNTKIHNDMINDDNNRLDTYDEVFQVRRNQQGEIVNGPNIDSGTY